DVTLGGRMPDHGRGRPLQTIPQVGDSDMKPIILTDDTFCRNRAIPVTKDMRDQAAKDGKPIPNSVNFLKVTVQGRQVQDPTPVQIRYEGKHLENAVKRAKRWL